MLPSRRWQAAQVAARRGRPPRPRPSRHQPLHRVRGRLRIRAATLDLPEAAVAVLAAEPAHGALGRGAAAAAHGGERLERGAGHVGVAARGGATPKPPSPFWLRTSQATVAAPPGAPDARSARMPKAV